MNSPKEELATTFTDEEFEEERTKMIQAINNMLESTTLDNVEIDKLVWLMVTTKSPTIGMNAYQSMAKKIGHDNALAKIKALQATLKIMS